MSATEPTRVPVRTVESVWRRVALLLGLAAAAGAVGAAAGLLAAGTLLSGSPAWERPSMLPLALWTATVVVAGAWLWAIGRRLTGWSRAGAAREIERRRAWPRGILIGAVEPGAETPGTSRALLERHRTWLGQQMAGRGAGELGGRAALRARRFAAGGTTAALLLGLASGLLWQRSPDRASAAWADLRDPIRHLQAPPLPPLELVGDGDQVRRGEPLGVTVGAPARDSVYLAWRPRGEPPQGRWLPVADGRATSSVPRVDAPTDYWARAVDGAISDTLLVVPIDPLLLLDVEVALRYPAHTGRTPETLRGPLPPISVPEGTRATVTGKTTVPIERAALVASGGSRIEFEPQEDRRFSARFPVRTGRWGWAITGTDGESLEGDPDSLEFLTVPDSAPRVEVAYPGMDTVLRVDMLQPLVIEARDDYGLARLEIVSWRISSTGERWPERVDPVPLADGGTRAHVEAVLDLRRRGLFPGDTVRYFVRGFDNAPEPGMGRSREYRLRLPTLDEARDRSVADAADLLESAERLAERARAHETTARSLERSGETRRSPGNEEAGAGNRGSEERGAAEYRSTESARRALEEADGLLREAEQIQEALAELRDAIEQSGLADSDVAERLQEIEALYRRLLTPELEERLEKLREALGNLDPDEIREAVRQLAEGSMDFRERVEQSVELLRRAALEQEFATLESLAQELVEDQERLLAATTDPDSLVPRTERRARDLSAAADSLAGKMDALTEELARAGVDTAGGSISEAQDAASEAARSDAQVAEDLRPRPSRARESAERALEQMQRARSAIQEGRETMQSAWRQEVVEALERSQAEAMELARRQESMNDRLPGARGAEERSALRSEEVALRRGLDQIREQLQQSARSSLLVDPSLDALAQQIGESMDRLLDQLADQQGRSQAGSAMGDPVSEGLNELAYRLMQSAENVAMSGSATGFQEALERLSQLADQQGQVNSRSSGLPLSAARDALAQQLRELAARQQGIGQGLERLDRSMGARGQVLGRLDAMAQEAQEIARELERGRVDQELIERQQRLFHRMLDAGRSLERNEFERERRAERPSDVELFRPDPLSPELLRGPRFPHPAVRELEAFPPAIRRLILEYFDLLNRMDRNPGDS